VVELVGVAAAGKTSLLLSLSHRDPTLRAGVRPPKLRHLRSAIAMAPIFVALHRPYSALLWNEMKRIAYLRTLQGVLLEARSRHGGVAVLDEGAVYMLARLLVFGGDGARTAAFHRWWSSAITEWAGMLDLIVWLDAPDSVLIDRLRARRQPHPVKALPDEAVAHFLGAYRDAYARVIGALDAARGPRVLTIRSDEQSVDSIADRVSAEISHEQGAVA
jgi:hypothetical protein